MIVVDSSVWIGHFRTDATSAVGRLQNDRDFLPVAERFGLRLA